MKNSYKKILRWTLFFVWVSFIAYTLFFDKSIVKSKNLSNPDRPVTPAERIVVVFGFGLVAGLFIGAHTSQQKN